MFQLCQLACMAVDKTLVCVKISYVDSLKQKLLSAHTKCLQQRLTLVFFQQVFISGLFRFMNVCIMLVWQYPATSFLSELCECLSVLYVANVLCSHTELFVCPCGRHCFYWGTPLPYEWSPSRPDGKNEWLHTPTFWKPCSLPRIIISGPFINFRINRSIHLVCSQFMPWRQNSPVCCRARKSYVILMFIGLWKVPNIAVTSQLNALLCSLLWSMTTTMNKTGHKNIKALFNTFLGTNKSHES